MQKNKGLWVGVKAAWMGVAVLILFVTLYAFDGKPNNDIGTFLVWSMLFLSFPSGLIYLALFTVVAMLIEKYLSTVIPTSYISLTMDWIALFALGYLQWFKLMPYLIDKLNKQK